MFWKSYRLYLHNKSLLHYHTCYEALEEEKKEFSCFSYGYWKWRFVDSLIEYIGPPRKQIFK